MAIPIGPGNVDNCNASSRGLPVHRPLLTASMALLMARKCKKRGLRDRVHLKKLIMGSERSSDAQRQRMKELLDVEHVFDIPGMTELYGPGTGLDCAYHEGIHYWADYYILELLNPETLEPVPPGETGEMVVTTLRKEAAPLIRYRTRDLTRLIPRRCSVRFHPSDARSASWPLRRYDHLQGREHLPPARWITSFPASRAWGASTRFTSSGSLTEKTT